VALPPESDEPTRRLPPTRPAEPLREREVVTTAEPDPAWIQDVSDKLRSLRTAVALLAVLSLAALGVGIWALLTQEEEGDARRGASQERVQELEDRVDKLETETGDAASQDAVERVREEQEQLEERLSAVEEQAGDGGAEDVQADLQEFSDAIEQNGEAIEQLDQRVGDLEQQQQTQDAP
jgi:hypothetical protein